MKSREISPKFDLVTTWGEECGIYEYARALLTKTFPAEERGDVFARKLGDGGIEAYDAGFRIKRCWTREQNGQEELKELMRGSDSDSLWFQYHPSFFEMAALKELSDVLTQTNYTRRVLTVHNPAGLENSAFANSFTDVVVHNERALAQLGDLDSVKTHVIPHFVYSREELALKEPGDTFTVATAGFAAANKQVPLLIRAFSMAYALNPSMRLQVLTSPLPTHSAHFERSRIVSAIKRSSARSAIQSNLAAKSMSELLEAISGAHIFCLPYADTSESASGAARMSLSAGVPILRSRSEIFVDLPGGDFVLEETSSTGIAEALLMLSKMPYLLQEKRSQIDKLYCKFRAPKIAARYKELLI